MKSLIKATELEGKRVLVRVDWNVPTKGGEVVDDFRIEKSLPTLMYLLEKGAKVVVATHLEPGTESVEPLKKYVPDGVELLENLRQNPGEKNNDEDFAKFLAAKADVFVNEAFSASHRKHASIVGVPNLLPSFAGLKFMEEVEHLSKAFNPPRPFLFVLGGAKFESKLPLLEKFVGIADKVFVGGALAHEFFIGQGKNVGSSKISGGEFDLGEIFKTGKIILPENLLVKSNNGTRYDTINYVGDRDIIVDAGPKDIKKLKKIIERSEFVLWNGPLGNYEGGFVDTTAEFAKLLAESGKEVIVGGGDTLAAIKEQGLLDKFSFVSTAGGAMLDFLANGTLPGIEALKSSS